MELPKLTKKVADEIRKDHQKFLQSEGLSEDFDDPDLENDEAQLANHKREALAKYLDCDVEEIEWLYDNTFSYGTKEYLVCDESEAYDLAVDYSRSLIDDLGLDSFSEDYRDYVINNFCDTDAIEDWMHEDYGYYADDIESESDDTFENRLIQEMYKQGILTDDDFEEVDGEIDYLTLKPEVNLEDRKEAFVDKLCENESPIDWLSMMYSEKDMAKVLEDNNAINWDEVAEDCVDTDGVAHFLASYDGNEIELENGLLAFRTN